MNTQSNTQWVFREHLYMPGITPGTEQVKETKTAVTVPGLLELTVQGGAGTDHPNKLNLGPRQVLGKRGMCC